MNILLIGSGGREHALGWALSASSQCDTLYCAPGNAGIAAFADCISLDANDHAAVVGFIETHDIGLTVVGPEAPLVAGLADAISTRGHKVFGPSAAAARLEGSKGFTKDLCARYNIPTAAYGRFSDRDSALAYLGKHGAPIVIKADGLAAGKGVTVAMTMADAETAVRDVFDGKFGAAGAEVVIEEFLEGEEISFFALCDGKTALPLASAQDHKRVGDGDEGPNTGGMGAYSPAPVMTKSLQAEVMANIVEPTLAAMADMGCPFKGVLFAGLMITDEGAKLIEYNVRFGDPECQVLMMRLKDDLVPLLLGSVNGTLDHMSVRWFDETALCVVMASEGYPAKSRTGDVIDGLEAAGAPDFIEVFHAGTARDGDRLVSNGGRVLGVTALGASVAEAQIRAYAAVDAIDWPQGFCRRDIGWRAVQREQSE